jgi:hypothetical protein
MFLMMMGCGAKYPPPPANSWEMIRCQIVPTRPGAEFRIKKKFKDHLSTARVNLPKRKRQKEFSV